MKIQQLQKELQFLQSSSYINCQQNSIVLIYLFIYLFIQLNIIDEFSTLICGTSIVLSITIYQADLSNNQEIILPFSIFLISLNSIFVTYILQGILLALLKDQQENLDKIGDKINKRFPNLIKSNHIIKRLLINREKQTERIHVRFQKIKKYLLNIVLSHPRIYQIHTQNDSSPERPKTEDFLTNVDQFHKNIYFNQKPKTNNKVYPINFSFKQKELLKDYEKREDEIIRG